jgi:hypothetical protein
MRHGFQYVGSVGVVLLLTCRGAGRPQSLEGSHMYDETEEEVRRALQTALDRRDNGGSGDD